MSRVHPGPPAPPVPAGRTSPSSASGPRLPQLERNCALVEWHVTALAVTGRSTNAQFRYNCGKRGPEAEDGEVRGAGTERAGGPGCTRDMYTGSVRRVASTSLERVDPFMDPRAIAGDRPGPQ